MYAKWKINSYTITFNTLGGTTIADITADYNTKIVIPTDPAKADHTFEGWYKNDDFAEAWNFDTDVVIDNLTLFAKWNLLSTAVEDPDRISLAVYPNPTHDFINIKGVKLNKVIIYNLLGRPQLQENMLGVENVKIDLNSLEPGTYFVSIFSGKAKIDTFKLIKK